MPPKVWIQLAVVLIALVVFVLRTLWAARQERLEDEQFRGSGKRNADPRTADPYRADPNSPWDDQRRLGLESEDRSQQESMRDHSRGFSQRVARNVDTSDVESKIDSEVHRKFDDRHLGALETDAETAIPVVAEAADSIWSNDPERLREAFILREILARPETRWQEDG